MGIIAPFDYCATCLKLQIYLYNVYIYLQNAYKSIFVNEYDLLYWVPPGDLVK